MDLYITLEKYQMLGNRNIVITNKLTSEKEIDLAIDNFLKRFEEIRKKAKKELGRTKME